MRPFVLEAGEGRAYDWGGALFTVMAAGPATGGECAVIEYATRPGEEPGIHTHQDEDEMFYVLAGSMTFQCGRRRFHVERGGFVFLPRNIPHGYTIRSRTARLLVITTPSGFGDHVEAEGRRVRHEARGRERHAR